MLSYMRGGDFPSLKKQSDSHMANALHWYCVNSLLVCRLQFADWGILNGGAAHLPEVAQRMR